MMNRTTSGYGAPVAVVLSGAALLLIGAVASTDAAFLGGITLGGVFVGVGVMLAVDVRRTRTWRRRAWDTAVSERTLHSIHAHMDRGAEEPRAARRWS